LFADPLFSQISLRISPSLYNSCVIMSYDIQANHPKIRSRHKETERERERVGVLL